MKIKYNIRFKEISLPIDNLPNFPIANLPTQQLTNLPKKYSTSYRLLGAATH
jgi:hypothetical protein